MPHQTTLSSGFMIIHGNRMEDLRDLMLQWLSANPLPPLTPEVLLVQSNGMKQWLVQSLAHNQGVCAATELYLPSEFLWQAYRTVLGEAHVPKQMPFDKSPLTWRILRLLDQVCRQDPMTYAPLVNYLNDPDPDQQRHYQLAQQIADLYDQYQSYRADWIQHWSAGLDIMINRYGQSVPLTDQQCWQAALWRTLQKDIDQQGLNDVSRASIHARFIEYLQQSLPQTGTLPPRIVVFGISSMPMQMIEALAALGRICQVLLFVNNPCQYYWGDLQDARTLASQQLKKAQRHAIKHQQPLGSFAEDYASAHPLLAAWGKQGKDYIQLLNQVDDSAAYAHLFQRVDLFVKPTDNSLLARLQTSILELASPDDHSLLADDDQSICFRSAYSIQREVEILHDHLLALFDSDTKLTPSDVMIMMPNVDQCQAAIEAVFGRFKPTEARYIPYSLSDSSARIEPMMQLLTWLLTLPDAEITLSDWHAMFELTAVRNRFGVDEADVALMHNWLLNAGVRWGLDAADRQQRFEVPQPIHTTSWLFGLERLLLGYAMGEGSAWQDIAPARITSGLTANLLGVLQQWLNAIRIAQSLLAHAVTPAIWVAYLTELLTLFFEDGQDIEAARWLKRFRDGLTQWYLACDAGNFNQAITLSVVRSAWLACVDSPSLQRPFLSGGVQFATLMPMRAIPFKIVCLIGMNDGDYPRQQLKQDFDLMANTQQWRAGDRSRRNDDRYLFLEAILSARQQLYISWTGKDSRDDHVRPASILVTQLRSYLTNNCAANIPVIEHPLQPFSERYRQPDHALRTYADDWMALKHVSSTTEKSAITLAPKAIPARLTLKDLNLLLRYPQQVLLKQRLGVGFTSVNVSIEDDELFTLTPLQLSSLHRQYLEANVAGDFSPSTTQTLTDLFGLTGQLPLAGFAHSLQTQLASTQASILQRWHLITQDFVIPENERLLSLCIGQKTIQGTLQHCLRNAAHDYLSVHFHATSALKDHTVKGHILIETWLHHLLACANELSITSVLIATDTNITFLPLPASNAQQQLQRYLHLYQQAWHTPLAVGCKTGIAYVQALQKIQQDMQKQTASDTTASHIDNTSALNKAEVVFTGGYNMLGEYHESADMQRCFDAFADIKDALPELSTELYGLMLASAVIS